MHTVLLNSSDSKESQDQKSKMLDTNDQLEIYVHIHV